MTLILGIKITQNVAQYPQHQMTYVPALKLLCPTVYEKMHLQENILFDIDFGPRSYEVLPSTLYIMWHMHLQNLKLVCLTV